MSLRVWLPLNGDLHNQGLDTITLTMSNATFTNDGKLGKCLSLPGIPTGNFSVPSIAGKKQMSIAYWVRVNKTISNNWLDGIRWYSTDGSSSTYSRQEFYSMNSSTNTTVTGFWYAGGSNYGYTHSVGEWHHYVIMIDYSSGYCWFYIDGVLKGTKTNVNTTHYLTGVNFKLGDSTIDISECDVRIYDHILSPKEIKLLSQGLVCHYKLSDWLDGINPNRLGLFPKLYSPISYCAYQLSMTENLIAGETYTLQLWDVDVSHSEKTEARLGVWIFWGGGSVMLGSWAGPSYFTNGHADHLVKTFTITASQASGSGATNAWFNMYNSVGYVAGTMNMHIGRWKLEKGDTATPYCHTTEEMGGEDTTVYDSSGNKYNGEKVGDVTSSNVSPRNTTSMSFVNGSYLRLQNMSVSGYTNSYTFAWWGKFGNCNGHMMWGFANGNRLNLYCYTNNCYWNTGDGSNNPFKVALSPYLDGNFHHFAITGDGTITKLYIDGEYKANAKTYKGITGTTLIFNGWDTGNSYNFNGSLSDFRLYATSLSAEDIQELYNTPVSVANTGAMLTQGEFVEVVT